MDNKNIQEEIKIKSYSVGELCNLYNVSYETLKKWLKPFKEDIGKRIGNIYNPKQIKKIFDYLGNP